jgi:hypothetical protein
MKRSAHLLAHVLVPMLWAGTLALSLEAVQPPAASAQAVPGAFQPQNQAPGTAQTPAVTTPQPQPSTTPPAGLPANIVTPSTTNQLEAGRARAFGSAGRGLPGMPGGPRLGGPVGAQDPSADYMRPPVIGPLFCDPAINIPC